MGHWMQSHMQQSPVLLLLGSAFGMLMNSRAPDACQRINSLASSAGQQSKLVLVTVLKEVSQTVKQHL